MTHVLYFFLMAAAMLALSRVLPGFNLTGWVPAIFASLVLGMVNAILKPILFVLTLPFTILTLGLFLFVLNALMLWITAKIVPEFQVSGWGTTFVASLILAAVSMAWKAAMKTPE